MKNTAKFLVLIFMMLLLNPIAEAQPKLLGTLPHGGNTETGIIYEISLDGSDFQEIHDFSKFNGRRPRGNLLLADNGKFYGLAGGGFGSFGSVLFEYVPETNVYIIKHDFFDSQTGMSASATEGSLIQASNGKLYGVTQSGASNYDGELFEYDLQTNTCNVKVVFEQLSKGKTPIGSLTEATNGKLYGVTFEGGANGLGVLYEYDPQNNIFSKLKDFDGINHGATPYDGVIQASNGKLYGMTREGGTSGLGIIYHYDINTNILTKIQDFAGAVTGASPQGKLLQASNGLLYGMTSLGGAFDKGAIFEYNTGTAAYTMTFSIDISIGEAPSGNFIELTDGYLYAMTPGGGVEDKGVLFKYNPVNGGFTKLLDFYGVDYGEYPYGSLAADANGKLYGMTYYGGAFATSGVLFEYDPLNGVFTKKFDFMSAQAGAVPYGSLLKASDGQIYGIAYEGGNLHGGAIYKLDPDDHSYQVVYNFDYFITGGLSYGSLIEASNGLFYGMANGGAQFAGVIFAFDPATSSYTVLHHFDDIIYGKRPYGSLLQASNGKLYGMATEGGANGDGVLFEYDIASSSFIKLLDFETASFGGKPWGSLIQAANGKLYGMTVYGGSFNKGVLFEYDPLTFAFAVKLHFDGTNKGAKPYGSLREFGDNQLFGITQIGGINDMGVLFVYDAASESYTKLVNFDGLNGGSYPMSTLMAASNNKLYGTTRMGGIYDHGVVFSYDPAESLFAILHDFTEYKDQPMYGAFLEVENDFGLNETIDNALPLSIYPNPVREILTIKIDQPKQAVFTIRIMNQLGQILMEQISTMDRSTEVNMNTSELDEGIYFLQLIDENGLAYSGKFVKEE
ncbi:MAG: T9SS type A sorting domain-containing protein [Bacteroidetes bacterium]|nr:T9SS type A sorting domain-containing protein [Bacteroidota bacterium]